MLNKKDVKYGLNDVQIIPATISSIRSRKECNPYLENSMLPLFTAPMDTVVDEKNYQLFRQNGITPIIPRTVEYDKRLELLNQGEWVAFGLDEALDTFYSGEHKITTTTPKILIDIANGHMQYLYDVVDKIREIYPNAILMVGNIANPETYRYCCEKGIDYCRVGIGGGSGCLTASNTSVFYSIASLISECYDIACTWGDGATKIIADGGMKNYSDIIKSLALGADAVMCGGIFAQMFEASGKIVVDAVQNYNKEKLKILVDTNHQDYEKEVRSFIKEVRPCKTFYGMSSKEAQSKMNKSVLKTSEGLTKTIEIKYTMAQWVENFISYLKSAMSYTNSKTLDELKKSEKILVSNNASQSFNR